MAVPPQGALAAVRRRSMTLLRGAGRNVDDQPSPALHQAGEGSEALGQPDVLA